MSHEELRVPVAQLGDVWIMPDDVSDHAAGLTCIVCSEPVAVVREHTRRGRPVRRHFTHRTNPPCALLSPAYESWLHIAAKLSVANAVLRFRAGKAPAPIVVRTCGVCRNERSRAVGAKLAIVGAAIERRIPRQGEAPLVLDVALMAEGGAVAGAVEVFVTHLIKEKRGVLEAMGIPTIEVEGDAVLRDPLTWRDREPQTCNGCKREEKDQREKIDAAWRRILAGKPRGGERYPGVEHISDYDRDTVARLHKPHHRLPVIIDTVDGGRDVTHPITNSYDDPAMDVDEAFYEEQRVRCPQTWRRVEVEGCTQCPSFIELDDYAFDENDRRKDVLHCDARAPRPGRNIPLTEGMARCPMMATDVSMHTCRACEHCEGVSPRRGVWCFFRQPPAQA